MKSTIDPDEVDASLDEASMHENDQKEEQLPEAPAVANIRVWIRGYGVIFTVRGEKMMDIVTKTNTLVDYAESHGWKSKWDTEQVQPATGTVQVQQPVQPVAPVVCGIHGTPMKLIPAGVSKSTGKPYNSFMACQSANADGTRCNWKPDMVKKGVSV